MRKHLLVTLMLTCGAGFAIQSQAAALPEPQTAGQSTVTIKGTVLDENDEPVIGASVTPKGKTSGVITDVDGNFTISVAPGTTLNVSYVGFKPESVKATNDMTVYLRPTTELLDQLVVVGYGTQKRANLTGAVATVDVARTMDSRPATDVARALQGAVPGLTISTANGDITANPQIRIRGTGTLTNGQSSAPLIVVDGVPVDDLSEINPDDIAEISVLKDAASSAVYGSRASFGVLLITTKEPAVRDKVSVKYDANFGWSSATKLPEYQDIVSNLRTAMDNSNPGGDEEIFGMYYSDLLPFAEAWQRQHNGKYDKLVELQPFQSWDNVGDYLMVTEPNMPFPTGNPNYTGPMQSSRYLSYGDWDIKKTMFHAAPSQKHNVSLEGTSGNTQYRLSFGYDSREGLMKYNPEKMRRYMANANVSTKITNWWKAGARFNFARRQFKTPNVSRNTYQYLYRWPSFFMNYGYVRDADGQLKGFDNDAMIRQQAHVDETNRTMTRMQAWMQFTPIQDLVIQTDFTFQTKNMDSESAYTPFDTYYTWLPGVGSLGQWTGPSATSTDATRSTNRDDLWTANVFATYTKAFGDHNLKVMAGWSAEREAYRYFDANRNDLVDYSRPSLDLAVGTNYVVSAYDWNRATTGFFGRINYDYKGIYLFEANGRYDASTNFPSNDMWAFFPSFSAGYRFSEEAYWADLKQYVSNGKIRASYGHIGNEGMGRDMFRSTISAISNSYVYWLSGNQKISSFEMPTAVSRTLTWERVITTDVGVDLGFLDNAITAGFDWYQRDTKDMLAPGVVLPSVFGASSPLTNAGKLRTRGWELSVGYNNSFGEANVWANFNLSDARTKVVEWNNPENVIYSYRQGNPSYYAGQYYGDIWGFETERYFTRDDFNEVSSVNAQGQTVYSYELKDGIASQTGLETGNFHYGPGDVKFKDLNGDGKIDNGKGTKDDHGDLKVIGNALPRYEYSFRLGGSFRGFDLDMFFQGVGKRNMWATGSTIVPMAQSGLGTFTNQTSYNLVKYGDDGRLVECEVNQGNDYPRMFSGASATGNVQYIGRGSMNFYPQSRYLMNMSYLRFKQLTVGYTLPVSITQKALIQKARVYFSAENLCFLHNGAGKYQLDAEVMTAGNSTVQGADGGYANFGRTEPMPRTFSFGIQLTL